YYAPRINQALDRAAREPVKAYAGSRLAGLVEASIRAEDYKRASAYLAEARYEAGIAEDARAPGVRLEKILELYHKAKAGRAEMGPVVEEFAKSPEDRGARPVLL